MKKFDLYFTLMGVLIGLIGCNNSVDQAVTSAVSEEALFTVSRQDVAIEESYSAAICGRQDIAIMPQVSGTLTELRVVEGQNVHKGQVLFVVDQVPFRAQVETSEANVKVAEANVATAQLVYESKQRLYDEQVISQFDLQTAKNSYLSAQAGLAQANAALVIARNNLNYTEVKSPSDGVVGTLPFRLGALVSPQMPQPLTTVSDNKEMYVYFSMTENQWLSLVRQYGSKEEALKQMPSVSLLLNDGTLYEKEGRIESVSGVIDQATGTVSVRASFPNPDGLLTAGGAGNVVLKRNQSNAISIPRTATFEIQDKVFVYKADNGHATATQINVKRLNGGKYYLVENGLQEGDVIITEGVAMLKDGQAI